MRYDGTRATLRGRFGARPAMEIHDHVTGAVEPVDLAGPATGHGGGDAALMAGFVAAVRGEQPPLTSAEESLESHLLAFAAEEARLSGTVVDMEAFRAAAGA